MGYVHGAPPASSGIVPSAGAVVSENMPATLETLALPHTRISAGNFTVWSMQRICPSNKPPSDSAVPLEPSIAVWRWPVTFFENQCRADRRHTDCALIAGQQRSLYEDRKTTVWNTCGTGHGCGDSTLRRNAYR